MSGLFAMDIPTECIRFYVLTRHSSGVETSSIIEELTLVHGEDRIPTSRTIYGWIEAIKEGSFSLSKKTSSGRPRSVITDNLVDQVYQMVNDDPRTSVRTLADAFDTSHTNIFKILTNELQMQKVCSTWVPHELTADHKRQRVEACKNIMKVLKPTNMGRYIVQDEMWVGWDIELSRSQNKTWLQRGQPRRRVPKPKLTNRKTMVLAAFTCSPPRFSISVLPKGQTVDAECVKEFLITTRNRFGNLRQNKAKFSEMLLQLDNARPHTAAITQAYLANFGPTLVKQSPYSPDLNLCDRFLFTRLQEKLKLDHFDSADEVLFATKQYCREMPEETLRKEFLKLRDHCKSVIECGGDYITS